ncbi:MAG: hypothetical protein RMN25_02270 [Anaerolineae bacterium]|nr:S1 family peptidase [Thermoflexales bacterium]MDW8406582.1 hypothetical protein [Anaerolineae bacterium]
MPDASELPFDAQRIASVRAAKDATLNMMMRKANVNAIGVGFKNPDRQGRTELAVVVSVERKLPLNELSEEDRVPPMVNGVRTDVVEAGHFVALGEQVQRMRPAQPGVSIGLADELSAGTFGCLVQRAGRRFILSNNHVIARSNQAPLGSVVMQPGRLDGGTSADRIATLAEFVPIAFEGETPPAPPRGCAAAVARLVGGGRSQAAPVNQPGNNKVDCAIAVLDDDGLASADILGIGAPSGVGAATLGTQIRKSGRTTGLTSGVVEQIDVSIRVDFNGRSAIFTEQLLAGAMSAPGDSGSVVLDLQGNVVGLLFAGSATATVITPIQLVLSALGIEVLIGG